MKLTVFSRILTATLLPVLLVIVIVIGTARIVIQTDGAAYAEEFTRLAAKRISEQTAVKLENAAILQGEISKELSSIDFNSTEAKRLADRLLDTLLLSNHDLYCTWFAFEPGVFPGEGRYYKTIMRAGDVSREIPDLTDELLDDPSASPWYNTPLTNGRVFSNVSGFYDYGLGEGLIHAFTMTYPIMTDLGRVIGCVGLDIRYEDLFPTISATDEEAERIMLVSSYGTILFSSKDGDIGKSLWDYGFQNSIAVTQAMRDKTIWQETVVSPFSGESLIVCLYPVDIAQTGQTVYLYRATSPQSLNKTLYSSMETIIATGVLGMILLTFSVFFSTRSIVRHVKRITDSFHHVANHSAEGTLDGERIPIAKTNVVELDMLQSALVKMMMQLRWAHGHKLKALESEVEKEKLIVSSEAKTNFFAAMSHEIRTPMNAILGISEIMLYEGNLTSAHEKYIRDIKISADSLLNIINDILDISKLETGKMELHPDHYNFRMLIDNIVSLSTHLASGSGLKFEFESDHELPLCLYGDGVRLRQVLLNLIGNAIKFTRVGHVTLRISQNEDTIRFSVIDSGVGIHESELEAIFMSFKRIDTRRNREVKGTGLGLSISKNLVELMGGTIEVESVRRKGSTFSVTIPRILGDADKLHYVEPRAQVRFCESLHVLIVDDDKTNLSVSSGLLKAAYGISSDTATSGLEAIVMVQKTDYDLIFMDHMMPELDGVDTTQRIRRLGEKYERIPIIALTANAVIGTREELVNGGMNDFLAKPIQSERLREILNIWIPEDKRLPISDDGYEAADEAAEPATTEIADPVFKALLEEAGVDTSEGMANIGFGEDTYRQSLRLLKERLPQVASQLSDLLGRQNMRDFHVHVHGLKGSLASVGASLLSAQVKALEDAAVRGNITACRTLLPPTTEKLQKLHEALCSALPEEASINSGTPIRELQRLRGALERYDYESITMELKNVLSAMNEPEKNKEFSKARFLIESFDYAGAAELIRGITASMKAND